MTQKEFIPYEQALQLQELRFDEVPMFGNQASLYTIKGDHVMYTNYGFMGSGLRDDYIPAPLYQQAFRWFREKYNLRGFIGFRPNVKQFDHHVYDMSLSGIEYAKQRTMEEYNKDPLVGTYEEAELACLKKLIEIVKNK